MSETHRSTYIGDEKKGARMEQGESRPRLTMLGGSVMAIVAATAGFVLGRASDNQPSVMPATEECSTISTTLYDNGGIISAMQELGVDDPVRAGQLISSKLPEQFVLYPGTNIVLECNTDGRYNVSVDDTNTGLSVNIK